MRLNNGMPVWHVSVSAWRRGRPAMIPSHLLEQHAVDLLRGVGGDREWWIFNTRARVGHLRVAITPDENAALPPGCAIHDAGESGPERPRTP